MIVVKANINEEVRRFRVEEDSTYESLCEILTKILLPNDQIEIFQDFYSIKYEDDEKDLIVVTSTRELEEAIRQAKENENGILRLQITAGPPKSRRCSFPSSTTTLDKKAPITTFPSVSLVNIDETPLIPTNTPTSTPSPDTLTPYPEPTAQIISPITLPELNTAPPLETLPESNNSSPYQHLENPQDAVAKNFELDLAALREHLRTGEGVSATVERLSDETALECTRLADDISRACVDLCLQTIEQDITTHSDEHNTDQLIHDCLLLSDQTIENCKAYSDKVDLSVNYLYNEIFSMCINTSNNCLYALEPVHLQIIDSINQEIGSFHERQRQRQETDTFDKENILQTLECESLSRATADVCLSLSNQIAETIMAI